MIQRVSGVRARARAFSFGAALLLAPMTAMAQQAGSVTGRVIDANGNPVANASVRVVDDAQIAVTDRSGCYRLADVKPGSHRVAARYIGLQADTASVTVDANRSGNPRLKPYRASNLDFSIEYYMRAGGLLSLGGFTKHIADPVSRAACST